MQVLIKTLLQKFIFMFVVLSVFQVSHAANCPQQDNPAANFNCSSGDVSLKSVTTFSSLPYCIVGSSYPLEINATFEGTSGQPIYDLSAYFLQTGADVVGEDGVSTCSRELAPVTAPFLNLNANIVGDTQGLSSTSFLVWELGLVDVACIANPITRTTVDIEVLTDYSPSNTGIVVSPYTPDGGPKCEQTKVSPGDIEPLGKLIVKKITVAKDGTTPLSDGSVFEFNATISDPLDEPVNITNTPLFTLSNGATQDFFVNLSDGITEVNIAETNNTSFVLDSVVCVDTVTPANIVTPVVSGLSFTVDIITASPQIECTVTNRRLDPPPCGDTVTLMTAEKWYSVSRPCGLVTNPTVAELFNAAPGLGVYGDNWGLWKLDGTNPGYNNSEEHTLLASDAEVMKSGVGYWMWSDTNVTWDPGAIALAANAIGTNWHVPTVGTNTPAELNITDPDVSAFYVVTPTADLELGLIRDVQEVLLGNPFNKAVTWENVYFSDDNGTTYKRADDNTTVGIRSTAWITNQDHTGNEVYPYEVISTTVGFTHTIEANQAFWIEVNGGYFAHPSERLAIPLEN